MPIYWLIHVTYLVALGPYHTIEAAEDTRAMTHTPDDWRIVQEIETDPRRI